MQLFRFLILLPFLVGQSLSAQTETIIPGGIVNIYFAVNSVSCNSAGLNSSAGLKAGDRFMIIQMKGGKADSANNSAYGNPYTFDQPSNYEAGYISGVSGNRVFFRNPLLGLYDVRSKVQLIRIAVYENARITNTIYPEPWNGATGGVIAIEITGILYLEGDINASGKGFQGGNAAPSKPSELCNGCNNVNIFAAQLNGSNGGVKGDGIFELDMPMNTGTAPNINGGGAGTCKNGGGGGGSNAGAGGKGGNSSDECGTPVESSAGKGGIPLYYISYPSRAFMGGGGGGGNQDNPEPEGSKGASGAGIIYLKAGIIRTNPGAPYGSILANGNSAASSKRDGAGAGGAGGTILIDVDSSRPVNISALGGDGGNVLLGREDFCYAPGGGGGGGLIRFTPGSSTSFVLNNVSPGSAGRISGVLAACNNSTFGADSGRSGLVLRDLAVREAIFPLNSFSLGNDTVICESKPVNLDAGANRQKILWSDGSTQRIFTPPYADTFWVEIIDEYGCYYLDTIILNDEGPGLELGKDTLLCPGNPVKLKIDSAFSDNTWFNGSKEDSVLILKQGKFWVEASRKSGCRLTDTINIIYSSEAIDLGPDTVICTGKALLLDAGSYYPSYYWSNGLNGRYNIITSTDTVWVRAISLIGCVVTDTILVEVRPGKTVELGDDTMGCSGSTISLDAGPGFISYEWKGGASGQILTVDQPGKYWVKVIDSNKCRDADTIEILLEDNADTLYIPNCFSPNRDGFNERFPGAELNGITGFEIHIYNSFGEKVFYSDNVIRSWDGIYMGKPAIEGVYLYILKWRRCNGRYKNMKGTFTLLR